MAVGDGIARVTFSMRTDEFVESTVEFLLSSIDSGHLIAISTLKQCICDQKDIVNQLVVC